MTLTWAGDLTFLPKRSKFAHKIYLGFVRSYLKFGGATLGLFLLFAKTMGQNLPTQVSVLFCIFCLENKEDSYAKRYRATMSMLQESAIVTMATMPPFVRYPRLYCPLGLDWTLELRIARSAWPWKPFTINSRLKFGDIIEWKEALRSMADDVFFPHNKLVNTHSTVSHHLWPGRGRHSVGRDWHRNICKTGDRTARIFVI